MKKCAVCGRLFEPRKNLVNKQMCCSEECRVIYRKEVSREYAASEAHRKKNRERQRAKAVTYCRLCGKPIERNYSTGHKDTSRMHDECVYKDILETLKAGKPLDSKQKSRLEFRGYTLAEFKEENNIL